MIVSCITCSKEFYTRPSSILRGGGKFCSKICFDKYQIGMVKEKKDPNENSDIGKRYGRYIIVKFSHTNKYYVKFVVAKCDCGNIKTVALNQLRFGMAKSCGCLQKEAASITGKNRVTHGKSRTEEYRIWKGMIQRCSNEKLPEYKYYGGRGIKVCDRWVHSFENFLEDMGKKPSSKHSIDRFPNNDGDYEPNNCRWATPKEQCANRRSNRFVFYNGEKLMFKNFALKLNVGMSQFNRYSSKHSFEEAVLYYSKKIAS